MNTGQVGDGKIFVFAMTDAVRIRERAEKRCKQPGMITRKGLTRHPSRYPAIPLPESDPR